MQVTFLKPMRRKMIRTTWAGGQTFCTRQANEKATIYLLRHESSKISSPCFGSRRTYHCVTRPFSSITAS